MTEIAFISITALFTLSLFSLRDVSETRIHVDGATPDSSMLQLKAGNHILGFAPDKAYLAAIDHGITDGTVGFQVAAYDRTEPLIIDPVYQWHTFYGSDSDYVYGMAVHGATGGAT